MDDPGSGAWATGEAINKAGNVVGGGQWVVEEGVGCVERGKRMPTLEHVDCNIGT